MDTSTCSHRAWVCKLSAKHTHAKSILGTSLRLTFNPMRLSITPTLNTNCLTRPRPHNTRNTPHHTHNHAHTHSITTQPCSCRAKLTVNQHAVNANTVTVKRSYKCPVLQYSLETLLLSCCQDCLLIYCVNSNPLPSVA